MTQMILMRLTLTKKNVEYRIDSFWKLVEERISARIIQEKRLLWMPL